MEILVRRAIDLWPTDFLTYRARGGGEIEIAGPSFDLT